MTYALFPVNNEASQSRFHRR